MNYSIFIFLYSENFFVCLHVSNDKQSLNEGRVGYEELLRQRFVLSAEAGG